MKMYLGRDLQGEKKKKKQRAKKQSYHVLIVKTGITTLENCLISFNRVEDIATITQQFYTWLYTHEKSAQLCTTRHEKEYLSLHCF